LDDASIRAWQTRFSRTCWFVEDENQVSKQTEAGGEFDAPDDLLGTIRCDACPLAPTNPDKGDIKLIATTIWATLHGVAMLAFQRLIPAGGPADEVEARKVSTTVAHFLIGGLFRPTA